MCRINPKVDLVFKKLFGSEENKDILKSFINSCMPAHQQLTDITLKNPYNLADYVDGKLSVLDIKAVDENGTLYDVEMQVEGFDYYGQRALFYWGKVFTNQLETSGMYSKLNKTIVISILDYICFPDDKRHHRIVAPRDIETHEVHDMMDYMELHFVELKKFKKELKELNTTLDRWITFLNNFHQYEKDKIPKELAADKEVKKAIEQLDVMYLNKKERQYYEAEQKAIRDRAAIMKSAVDNAEKRGEEKGIKKGKKEGLMRTAAGMKKKGMANDLIADVTGLSPEEISSL
ncbi:MAG: Rpn family recombination-promoting nuclease/putative transposase [bacterium]|nr:Rpn family recombination-promoting nuclease/putative transposase [bacterium]